MHLRIILRRLWNLFGIPRGDYRGLFTIIRLDRVAIKCTGWRPRFVEYAATILVGKTIRWSLIKTILVGMNCRNVSVG